MDMLYAAPHFHYCVIDGRIVGLDLRAARYFFVRGASADALLQLEAGDAGSHVPESEALKDLLKLGYVTLEPSGGRPLRRCRAEPATSRVEWPRLRSRGLDTLLLCWRLAITRLCIATGSLSHVLRPIEKRASHMEICDIRTLRERLGRFMASRPSIPLPRSCLLDSAVLYLFLGDASVDLVFGVTVTPFAAHCWLERDGHLLNDELDYVRRFTPIMRFRP